MIIKLFNKLLKPEFIKYLLVGGFATILDWSLFYLFAITLNTHYQIAIVISFLIAGTTHYTLNKIFTFKCKSRKILKQYFLFISTAIVALFLSMLIMFVLVDVILIEKMTSKILTTGILLMVNYTIHKNITFNKRFFR